MTAGVGIEQANRSGEHASDGFMLGFQSFDLLPDNCHWMFLADLTVLLECIQICMFLLAEAAGVEQSFQPINLIQSCWPAFPGGSNELQIWSSRFIVFNPAKILSVDTDQPAFGSCDTSHLQVVVCRVERIRLVTRSVPRPLGRRIADLSVLVEVALLGHSCISLCDRYIVVGLKLGHGFRGISQESQRFLLGGTDTLNTSLV